LRSIQASVFSEALRKHTRFPGSHSWLPWVCRHPCRGKWVVTKQR